MAETAEKVIAIKGVLLSAQKQQWLDQIAMAIDKFAKSGIQPQTMICVLQAGNKVRSTWDIHRGEDWSPGMSAALLIAGEHLRRQAFVDEGETDGGPDGEPAD